ncbi:MAG TPA: AbrB/MazE/SpoVT family DNA-binding domain-containing protein [Candidatus Binatia bacterium]|nr:AbrB/MazE/SpoVT family DNA-binding domain-containing protein [Candidatus Binatia bacterium]
MALLKILRSSQITLPAELRRQFGLAEGDYLEAQAVKEGILLKPVNVVDRQKAGHALLKLLDRVHTKQLASKHSTQEQEEWITQEVKAFRKDKQSKRHA